MRILRARSMLAIALLLSGVPGRGSADWGSDFEEGAAEEGLDWTAGDLAAIVHAAPADRDRLVSKFISGSAEDAIETLKRFRNPELLPIFRRLLAHADWHVVHRALLLIERLRDGDSLPAAWALLGHGEPRLRERAAITCLRLVGDRGSGLPDGAREQLRRRREAETDEHVRFALRALEGRMDGRGAAAIVSDEVRVTRADGLVWTPFLRKMSASRTVARGYRPAYVERLGAGTAVGLPITATWTKPLLRFGHEETLPRGRGLQTFGFRRNGAETVHTGIDVGAFLDGAGLYAAGPGLVKEVYTGSDMGTEIVIEHHVSTSLSPDGLATVLYMHAADVVFVAAGERVEAGQLIGEVGLGFSFENGGHYAHLHLGVYPGAFRRDHNYGYKTAADGLADWLDPAVLFGESREASPGTVPKPTADERPRR